MNAREQRQLRDARAALDAGRWAEAAAGYQKLVAASPPAAHGYGLALLRLGQTPIGIAMLQRAAAAEPANAAFHASLAEALAGADPKRALAHAARAAELEPLPATLRVLARLAYEQDALDALDDACARLPDHGRPYGLARPASSAPPAPLPGDLAHAAAFAAQANLRVIDDLLPDPAAWRAAALALPFRAVQYAGQNFPGRQTDGQPCRELMQRIATLLGRPVKWSSPDNGAYRLSLAGSTARADIHVDQPAAHSVRHHAGVLYLNPPQQCRGGTQFWRHRATGWERRPSAAELRQHGYASAADFQHRWLKRAEQAPFEALKAGRLDWEPLLEVPMRWNRLVVYRSDFFHSISDVFGSSPDDGRLVQLFFFETA